MDVKNTKDRGLKDIIIDEDTYTNLINMLSSSEEDKIVALTNINNLDQKANVIPILFLRKECTRTNLDLWKEHANKSIKYQRTLGVDDSNNVIKYKNILAAINKQKVKKESNIEFFCRRFEKFVKDNLIGFDFIENVQLKITVRDEQ
jgi:hypothetical protein